jgi:hypothetical protein
MLYNIVETKSHNRYQQNQIGSAGRFMVLALHRNLNNLVTFGRGSNQADLSYC